MLKLKDGKLKSIFKRIFKRKGRGSTYRGPKKLMSLSEKRKKRIELLKLAMSDPDFKGNRQEAERFIRKLEETALDDIGQSSFEELKETLQPPPAGWSW